MCQMKPRSVRGSRPWMAMRKRRPQPAMARSGQAGASALITASMISLPQWLVHKVTGAPALAHTTVPGLAITLSGRKAPSFFGVSESIKYASAAATGAHVGVRRVDETCHLGIRRRQIDGQVAAALLHCSADHDVV